MLNRLFQPKSIAVVGGGAWCREVANQAVRMGFSGPIHLVHPKGDIPRVEDLPDAPDAVFIGVNRHASVDIVRSLSAMGAGGAVCFASGFAEAATEDAAAQDLQAALVAAAGEMPVLGPNCYGFINALDGALLWPDQHGCTRVSRGVAILTQSSNIAINLTMQQRAVPIAYVVTCGNMAQTSQAAIAMALLDDPRVTAIGMHIEGFGDIAEWYALASKAAAMHIPIIALKVGASEQAQAATVSHTASLAGSDAGASALLARLGIGRVHDLPSFLEALKLLSVSGQLAAPSLSSISCSGGEASLVADMVHGTGLAFPALTDEQEQALAEALGPMVALSNPLDYHTYVWRDVARMTAAWLPMAAPHIGLTLVIVDYPHTDAGDWLCATQAALAVRRLSGGAVAVVATLPELMPEDVAAELIAGGVVPMNGLREAIEAARIAANMRDPVTEMPLLLGPMPDVDLVPEPEAKAALAAHGVAVPGKGKGGPLVVKGLGHAHKSEAGLVKIGVDPCDVAAAKEAMGGGTFLVEEMVQGGVAEILIGVTRDPAHGFVLTLGAGGVLTELWQDTVSLLVPADRQSVADALSQLRIWPMIEGYRGKPAANLEAILTTVEAVQAYVIAHATDIGEVEINPLICTPERAVAVDALIRKA